MVYSESKQFCQKDIISDIAAMVLTLSVSGPLVTKSYKTVSTVV